MKQTIFNASLEESMNLVTDEYIKASLEDFNEKGYEKKILGLFTIQLFLFLIFLISFFIDSQKLYFFFMNVSLLNGILFVLGFIGLASYLNDVKKIKNQIILSYYYNKSVYFMIAILFVQLLVICVSGAGIIIGSVFSSLVYSVFFVILVNVLFNRFKNTTYEILYKEQSYTNRGVDFINYFVKFAQKYGGIVILLLILLRIFFPGTDIIQQNDVIRTIFIAINPLLFIPFIYFAYVLAVDNFQGYYLQKYLEEYRELSGYSIEEWYGKKSKRYKEYMDKKD